MSRIKFLLIIFTIPALPFFVFSQQQQGKQQTEVIILHVNDMHSKIDNMAKLAYLADSLRRNHPYVFVVGAGDNFTGNPVVDMIKEKGYPMVDLMNSCGFNVSEIGNHEFDMGQAMLNNRIAQAKFPFICCNLDATGALLKPPKPYAILEAGPGTSIAMLGILQLDDNGLPSAHPDNMKGVKFENGISKAREFKWLKSKYGILIALSHLGIDDDKVLADSMNQLDVIIGGHSHTLLEKPVMENNVMIVQTGSNLKYVGKLTLEIENGHVTARADEVIPFTALARENAEVRKLIDQYNDQKEFRKVVGTAKKPLNGLDELGSLMTDALTNGLKVDAAFQNKGGIRIQNLEAGDITLKDIYKLDPFNNQVVVFSMTTKEIESLICYGFHHESGIDLQVSGMTYEVTGDGANHCKSVKLSDINGQELNPSREYRVAMNNYMATTYKFDHHDPGTAVNTTTAEALLKFLGASPGIDYAGVKRAFQK